MIVGKMEREKLRGTGQSRRTCAKRQRRGHTAACASCGYYDDPTGSADCIACADGGAACWVPGAKTNL